MKKQFLFFILLAFSLSANAQGVKAFVGGTLIDGFGGNLFIIALLLLKMNVSKQWAQ